MKKNYSLGPLPYVQKKMSPDWTLFIKIHLFWKMKSSLKDNFLKHTIYYAVYRLDP